MKKVIVITTGGTIPMKRTSPTSGTVAALKGEDLLAQLPRDGLELQFEEFTNLPSSHLTPSQILVLSQKVSAALHQSEVAGVVVTHGTDTLEETAYLLDLVLAPTRPVVVTGSIRTAATPGYDGLTNLAAAIRVAATPAAVGMGVLVVFHEHIFAASEVQKTYSQADDAFSAPGSGPLGRIIGDQVRLQHYVAQRQLIACQRLEERVDLIRLVQGGDDRQLRHAVADGVAGVVLETFGGGRVPPWWLPTISDALARRVVLVVATRCGAGPLYDEYGYVGAYHDLRRLGVLFAHNLSGVKARIKLMVALGTPRKPGELRALFAES